MVVSSLSCFDFLNLYSESIDFKVSYALGLALASFNNLNALWPLKLQTQHWNCCVTKLTVSFFFLWLQLGQVKTADC